MTSSPYSSFLKKYVKYFGGNSPDEPPKICRRQDVSVQDRIITIRLLEKMKQQPEFCKGIGLFDASNMDGKLIMNSFENKESPREVTRRDELCLHYYFVF